MVRKPGAPGGAPAGRSGRSTRGPTQGAKKLYGVRIAWGEVEMTQPEPVNVVLPRGGSAVGVGYRSVDIGADGFSGMAEVRRPLGPWWWTNGGPLVTRCGCPGKSRSWVVTKEGS